MRADFPSFELLGGAFGVAATAVFVWAQCFGSDKPSALISEQLAGDVILTLLLLAPFVAVFASVIMLPVRARWPVLVCSAVVSAGWLATSGFTNNYARAPHPTPSGPAFALSLVLFFPSAIMLTIAAVRALRHSRIRAVSRQKTASLVAAALLTALILGMSLRVLFLDQQPELWSRVLPGGEWVRSLDVTLLPTGPGDIQGVDAGVVRPAMSAVSAGLLALGVSFLVVLFRLARKFAVSPVAGMKSRPNQEPAK